MNQTPFSDSIAARKAALREAALSLRDALDIDDRLIWDEAITERVLALFDEFLTGSDGPLQSTHPEEAALAAVSKDSPARLEASFETRTASAPQDEGFVGRNVVSAYWPMRSEADPRPVLEGLHARGLPLCLPAIVGKRMLFRRWAPYEPIVPGGFGTLVPQPEQPETVPTILIVPLAAFDRRGYRIGYGKGHYDAKLTELGPVVSIGIAYAAQEIDVVPDEPHDRRLDWIVTERETIACR